jgi:hypothetical protein
MYRVVLGMRWCTDGSVFKLQVKLSNQYGLFSANAVISDLILCRKSMSSNPFIKKGIQVYNEIGTKVI